MKMVEALRMMGGFSPRPKGYMVSFEWKDGSILTSDHFPDKHKGEDLIKSEDEAWEMAEKFAKNTVNKCVNIYVIDDQFSPVPGFRDKLIENRLLCVSCNKRTAKTGSNYCADCWSRYVKK